MRDGLPGPGHRAGHQRIRRLLREMGAEPVRPKRNPSKRGKAKHVRPYLLRNLRIERPDQVRAIATTHIPMEKGSVCLAAAMDICSRHTVGRQISDSPGREARTGPLTDAVDRHGRPGTVSSGQGSRCTCAHWPGHLKQDGTKVGTDGEGRAADSAFIERFPRTLKWKHTCLCPASDGTEPCNGVGTFVNKHNNRRHRGINRERPSERCQRAA